MLKKSTMVVLQVVPRQTKATQFQQKLNDMKVKFNAREEVIPACARRHDAVHSSSLSNVDLGFPVVTGQEAQIQLPFPGVPVAATPQ